MNLIELLKQDEGFRANPYRDINGKLTIGYGHCLETNHITERAAQVILEDDVESCIKRCSLFIPLWDEIPPVRQAVLISLCFNVGLKGLQKFQRMLLAIHMKNWSKAADELLDSDAARQLPTRYARLAEMMRTGEWIR